MTLNEEKLNYTPVQIHLDYNKESLLETTDITWNKGCWHSKEKTEFTADYFD